MNTTNQAPDAKVVERIRKLLALANDGRGNEAEMQLAAERAAELMEQYGLEMAQIEASGGKAEGREQSAMESARGAWYGALMSAVAESFFCSAFHYESDKRIHFTIIGRKSGVTSTQVTYSYLRQTIWRLSREAVKQGGRDQKWFRHGCAERVIERLRERHARVLQEQREQAERQQREAAARASHPSAAPSSTALVVVLGDWAEQERDLNEDFRRGVPPGTTSRERAERAARIAARDARYEALKADGVESNVAWRMAYMGQSREDAEKAEADTAKRRALEKPSRASGWTQSDQRRWESRQRREERAQEKRNSTAFRAGRTAGESVGLDQQVTRRATPKIA